VTVSINGPFIPIILEPIRMTKDPVRGFAQRSEIRMSVLTVLSLLSQRLLLRRKYILLPISKVPAEFINGNGRA